MAGRRITNNSERARKKREHMGKTTLSTLLTETISPSHRAWGWAPSADGGSTLYYPNGSEVLCAGLDNPGRMLSGEFMANYTDQGEELEEDEFLAIWALQYITMNGTNPIRNKVEVGLSEAMSQLKAASPFANAFWRAGETRAGCIALAAGIIKAAPDSDARLREVMHRVVEATDEVWRSKTTRTALEIIDEVLRGEP